MEGINVNAGRYCTVLRSRTSVCTTARNLGNHHLEQAPR